jgi:hypothetical protein
MEQGAGSRKSKATLMREKISGLSLSPKRLNLELSGSPISGTTATVSDGENLNRCFCDPVNHAVWKTAEEILSRTMQVPRPSLRSGLRFSYGAIELGDKSICHGKIAIGIPLIGSSRLCDGLGMELNAWTSHEPGRGFDVARRTKEPFSLLPYPTHQYDARFLFPTPLPHPHPLTRRGFLANDLRVRHVLQEADGGLPLKVSYDSNSSDNCISVAFINTNFPAREAECLG